MVEAGRRERSQPAPPWAVVEALAQPDRDPARRWLVLVADERPPDVVEVAGTELVVWSSLWPRRPDARVRFDVRAEVGGSGSLLRWTLLLDEPLPDPSLLGHLRKRLNELINAELRYSFGA